MGFLNYTHKLSPVSLLLRYCINITAYNHIANDKPVQNLAYMITLL